MDVEVVVKDTKRKKSHHNRCLIIVLVLILIFVVAALIGVIVYLLFIRHCSFEDNWSHENSTVNGGVTNNSYNSGKNGTISGETNSNTPYTADKVRHDGVTNLYRLPQTFMPLNYNLSITPYFYPEDVTENRGRFTFDGRVRIVLQCMEATDHIIIHSAYINLEQLNISQVHNNDSENLVQSYEQDFQKTVYNISLAELTVVGETYILEAVYYGFIHYWEGGLFRTSFIDDSGIRRWGGITQMQTDDARKVLPCFDEPSIKATFDVTIRHRADMTALSNGIELSTTDLDGDMTGWKETVFKTTPKMPTYLLALAVTHYVSMNKTTSTGTLIRVWTTPQNILHTQYALDSAVKFTELFDELFDYEYHLEKQDMLCSPDMLSAGMENWGLIIYTDEAMIYNPAEHTVFRKQLVAMIVAHEIAHQWFGNLVTCEWWDDIWLNEGLTEYWSFAALDNSEPKWDVQSLMLDEAFTYAMENDVPEGYAVKPSMSDVWGLDGYFSDAAYYKGASLARMLRNILGADVFLLGMKEFLKKFAFGNADSDDFWNLLTEVDATHGGHNVKTIMDQWILEKYYPVVTMQRGQDKRSVNVSQSVFLTWPENERLRATIGPIYWHIPISYTYESRGSLGFKTPNRTWLNGEETGEFLLPYDIKQSDWYLVNIGFNGYYRINYDADNWRKIARQLLNDHTVIPMENRYQVLDDAYSMFKTNAIDIQIPLDLTVYLDKEIEYLPWLAASLIIGKVHRIMRLHPSYQSLRTYWLDKISSLYHFYGWSPGKRDIDPKEQKLRVLLIEQACKFGSTHCLQTVKEYYGLLMANVSNSPIFQFDTIEEIIHCYAIKEGGDQEWNFAMEQIQITVDYQLEWNLLQGLCCSKDPWRLRKLLRDLHTGNLWISYGFELAIKYMTSSDVGFRIAWEYVQKNFKDMVDDDNDYVYNSYNSNNYDKQGDQTKKVYIAGILDSLGVHLLSEIHLQQLVELKETYEAELDDQDMFNQAIQVATANVKEVSDFADIAGKWFEQHV